MVVTAWQNDFRLVSGVLVISALEGQGQISVREAIAADIELFKPTDFNQLVGEAVWAAHSKITSYDISAVKTIAGFPLSAQFGSITYNSLSTFLHREYIANVFQAFSPQRCIVEPIAYADLPYSESEIVVAGEVLSVTLATVFWTGGERYVTGYKSMIGATGFYYDLPASVIATITVPYVVKSVDMNPAAQPGVVQVFNY